MRFFARLSLVAGLTAIAACSSAKKKDDLVQTVAGSRVALVEITGEGGATAQSVVEVALINELSKNGLFELVSKQDLQAARDRVESVPGDAQGLAKAVGADFALAAHVKRFSAEEKKGVTKERVYDSQLAAEQGKDRGETDRLIEARSLTGEVEIEFVLTNAKTGDVIRNSTQNKEEIRREAREGAIRFPPRLRFLEQVTGKAVANFLSRL